MSTFEVKVYKLKIEPHHNADTLELAVVGDYRSIVRKGQFKTGDLGVYIPEASIVPDWLIEKLGLIGKLAGKEKNRVKAVKLRGVVSQGLVYPVISHVPEKAISNAIEALGLNDQMHHYVVAEGQDVTNIIGITKWEPPIPVHMAGEVFNAFGHTLSYDIENIKKFPDIIEDGEDVVMTEKLHGTWTCLGYAPQCQNAFSHAMGYIVTSKGLSGQGLAFKFNEANTGNLYLRTLEGTKKTTERGVEEHIIDRMMDVIDSAATPFYILGETFGKGVQDLAYGTKQPEFRVFDIYLGEPGKGRYLRFAELSDFCARLEVDLVPVLYEGPFSKAILVEITNGKETISGTAANIREGVVVKPLLERRNELIGRVQLKSVSDAYLLRGGEATELT